MWQRFGDARRPIQMVPNPMRCCCCFPCASTGFEEPEEPVAFRRHLMRERLELGFAVVFGGLEVVEIPETIQSHKSSLPIVYFLRTHWNESHAATSIAIPAPVAVVTLTQVASAWTPDVQHLVALLS